MSFFQTAACDSLRFFTRVTWGRSPQHRYITIMQTTIRRLLFFIFYHLIFFWYDLHFSSFIFYFSLFFSVSSRQRWNGKVLESAAFEICKPWWYQNDWQMECQQTYPGTDQNGSRQIKDQSRTMIKSVSSSNKVEAIVKKANNDFGISLRNL